MLRPMSDLAALYRQHVKHLTEGYHEVLERVGYDAVVVHAGRLAAKSSFDDQDWPFRAVPAFEHWADVAWPDSAVVVRRGAAPALFALRSTSFWERPREPDFERLRAGIEVHEVTDAAKIGAAVKGAGKVAFIGHDPGHAAALDLAGAEFSPAALIDRLHALRTKKTAYEIACLEEASLRAARGHASVAAAFEAGVRNELDLHLTYLMATEQDDADCPYKNIVALGASAAVLHHIDYRDAPEAKSLLVDAGARVRGYGSDITRTTAAPDDDHATVRFAELVDRMDALQQSVIGQIVVGQPYEALHDQAHVELGQLIVDFGLAKISAEACVQTGLTRVLFPHGLGHGLGVQVHDVGMRKTEPRADNPFLRNTSVIEPGQVFTVEPGLYFIDHLLAEARAGAHADSLDWGLVEALAPYGGVRIEDDVVVQAKGVKNLTREAFAALERE